MPFTFAHPAAVIPLQALFRRYVCFTGLVVGSMSPDFEYFIHFKPYSVWGHTLAGFFLYNFPLVLLVSWLFHRVIKKPLLANLPAPFDRWYAPFARQIWSIRSRKAFLLFFSSSIIGMITHVLWDHFTHQNGYFVTHFAALRTNVHVLFTDVPVYKLAQHGSTLTGFAIIAAYLYMVRDPHTNGSTFARRTSSQKRYYWIAILFISCVILSGKLLFFTESAKLGDVVVSLLDSVMIAVLLASLMEKRVG